MTQPQQPSLRFDHREIAVIFSLFVFVSLLMFTVGILVGKGMAAARYEEILAQSGSGRPIASLSPKSGTSVSLGEEVDEGPAENHAAPAKGHGTPPATTTRDAHRDPMASPSTPQTSSLTTTPATVEKPAAAGPLKWIPQKDTPANRLSESLLEPGAGQSTSNDVLKNPRIRALLEEEAPKRKLASASSSEPPKGGAEGKFTVQIGSYPTQKDAEEKVAALKKMGFAHAYFSSKALGDQSATWYRVWLGYYPDFQSAKSGAEFLQRKGEVKNYLVRKSTDS